MIYDVFLFLQCYGKSLFPLSSYAFYGYRTTCVFFTSVYFIHIIAPVIPICCYIYRLAEKEDWEEISQKLQVHVIILLRVLLTPSPVLGIPSSQVIQFRACQLLHI